MKKLSRLFLDYLRHLARIQLAKIRFLQKLKGKSLTVVGITGSAGKTSCLLATEAALKPNFIVKTNYGGNSETGIPLNILGLKISDFTLSDWFKVAFTAPIKLLTNWQSYDVYLLEMGIDAPYEPKNMSYLLKIVHPDIGVFLNVSTVHLHNFKNIDEIAANKAKLVNSTSISILNSDDPLVKKYSHPPQTSVFIKPLRVHINGFELPDIYDITFGAAVAIATQLGLEPDAAIKNLKSHFKLPPSRASYLKCIKQSHFIDSSYNSSPLAAAEMLNFLAKFPSPRIAVLGDMRELGSASETAHKKLYRTALKSADTIISVGPETKKYFGDHANKFDYWWQAAGYLQKHLPSHSTILVKGSQNTIYLEELVKALLREPRDSRLLCRQSRPWLKTKKQFKRSHAIVFT